MAGGGGSASGKITFADHVTWAHRYFIAGVYNETGYQNYLASLPQNGHDLLNAFEMAWGAGSPFDGEEAYDPDSALSDIESRLSGWLSILDALSTETDYQGFVEKAKVLIDYILDDDADIEVEVQSFADESQPEYLRTLNRYHSSQGAAGAWNGSSVVFGTALLESERRRQINRYRAALKTQRHSERMNGIMQMTTDLQRNHWQRIDALRVAVLAQLDYGKTKIVTKDNQYQTNLEWDVRDRRWFLELFGPVGNFLGAPAGGVTQDVRTPSKLQSGLSGALGIGAAGAMMGNMIAPASAGFMNEAGVMMGATAGGGPIGLGIGAAVGLAMGLLS